LSNIVNKGIDKKNVAMLVPRAIHLESDSHDLLFRRMIRAPRTGRNITVLRIG
jgi:hypothetical protein